MMMAFLIAQNNQARANPQLAQLQAEQQQQQMLQWGGGGGGGAAGPQTYGNPSSGGHQPVSQNSKVQDY